MSQVTARPAQNATLEHWKTLLQDSRWENMPFKIETNQRGQIIMSPTAKRHGRLQTIIAAWLETHMPDGDTITEAAIQTTDGVRVADVAWASTERYEAAPEELFVVAPEICVEVWSPSNTPEEFERKRELYLQAGASEFWTCDHDGHMQFFDASGETEQSALVASFPKNIMEKNDRK
jgi:Uma2 family endonuclease